MYDFVYELWIWKKVFKVFSQTTTWQNQDDKIRPFQSQDRFIFIFLNMSL